MTDIPGNTSTTASIAVGGSTTGDLEVLGDQDWFRITLTAGQQVTVEVDALTSHDPNPNNPFDTYLNIYDSTGNTILFSNDDINLGIDTNSRLSFTASYSGTYYIDVGAYANSSYGTYQLSVQPYTPPPLATNDQIAAQLVSGYWGGDSHHWAVTQGGTLTVNISTLNAGEQNLARAALQEWSDIIGVHFQEVTTGGQIVFDDTEQSSGGPIAATDANWSNGIISHAHVHISTSWVNSPGYGGTNLGGYSFQTYIHEIGHALGLGHAGDYNNTASYPTDALFENDAWSTSIMSYFDQHENTYFAGQGFTINYDATPMVADILAMQTLYGLSTTTRTGNTTYGYNSTMPGSVYDATAYPKVAYTIFDSGGNDTIDYSGTIQNQLINLNPETFSNVNGYVGNLSIARGVVIENAIGGNGSDTIIGNSANNVIEGNLGADTLTGGGGSDTFLDTKAGHNGDTITDFSTGDSIVFSDATLAGFTFSLSGHTLTYSGGSLTLTNVPNGTLVASAASSGGVQISVSAATTPHSTAHNDFNGDGLSDILWRDDSGHVSDWLGTATGGFVNNDANAAAFAPSGWNVVGTGDFNGDGRADILWRNPTSGAISDWLGTPSGGFSNNDANAAGWAPTGWSVVGTGDFNGDGRDDILWRDTTGHLSDWLGTSSGGFSNNDANAAGWAPTGWTVVGTGDFNGDGRDDILWRDTTGHLSDWLGTSSGGFVSNDANASSWAPTNWHVVGTGDFNGDGRTDILWRDDTGHVSDWLGTASGGFVSNDSNAASWAPTNWHIVQIGDFNGDGRDDILWRDDTGHLSDWLGTSTGGFINNDANAAGWAPTNWHVQAPSETLV